MEVPLRNYKKEIIGHAIVSTIDYEDVMKYKWNNSQGYASGYINKKIQSLKLHHFILGKPAQGLVIDHINGNSLDNRRENLRFATYAQNNQNARNISSTNTIYRGVSYVKKVNKWRAASADTHIGHYLTDKEAGLNYDIFTFLRYGELAKNNNLIAYSEVEGKNWLEDYDTRRKKNLPKNISRFKNYYRVRHTYKRVEKTVGYYNTLEQAQLGLIKYLTEEIQPQIDKENEIKINKDILRNDEGIAILELSNKNNERLDCLVDDDDWHNLSKYKWCFDDEKYVYGYVDGKRTSMHKYLCKVESDKKVDHINRVTYDNRKSNLREATNSVNAHNATKPKNCSSIYVGVTKVKDKEKWKAYINKDGKRYSLKTHNTPESAAKAYNKKAIELYGEFANLNHFDENEDSVVKDLSEHFENINING